MDEKTTKPMPETARGKSAAPPRADQADSTLERGAGVMKSLTEFATKLLLGRSKAEMKGTATADVSTGLAYQRTDLAMDRNLLAAERTLMAWIRTALSMISFGFTLGKLGQVLHEVNVKGIIGRTRTLSVENIAYFLVILGTGALILASWQHWRRLRELRAMGLRRQLSVALIVAILLSAVGGFTLSALILAL
jgi:putative membrane protein